MKRKLKQSVKEHNFNNYVTNDVVGVEIFIKDILGIGVNCWLKIDQKLNGIGLNYIILSFGTNLNITEAIISIAEKCWPQTNKQQKLAIVFFLAYLSINNCTIYNLLIKVVCCQTDSFCLFQMGNLHVVSDFCFLGLRTQKFDGESPGDVICLREISENSSWLDTMDLSDQPMFKKGN